MLVDLNVTHKENEQRELIRFTHCHIVLHRPPENQPRLLETVTEVFTDIVSTSLQPLPGFSTGHFMSLMETIYNSKERSHF